MELNRCKRCGAFFVSNNEVCPNCEPKDNAELFKLRSFINDNNDIPNSLESLACQTGISEKNLNRFLQQPDFSVVASNINDMNIKSIKIDL